MMRKNVKMNKKVALLLLSMVLVVGLLTGCGSSSLSSDKSATGYNGADSYEESAEEGFSNEMSAAGDVTQDAVYEEEAPAESVESKDVETNTSKVGNKNQKIIKRYDYRYETENFDEAFDYLKKQVSKYNGYVSNSEIAGKDYDSGYRTLRMTARIPAEDSEAFVSGLGELGTIIRQSESAEDVTLQYSDTESRIDSLKTEQERLLELLKQADSLETIITLEDRLTEVRYELENYQSRKKLYDNLISYSTVDIVLEEVKHTVQVDESTFFSRVLSGLKRSVRDIAYDLVAILEWFIINLPYFVVWGIIIFIIVKIVRKENQKRRAKKLRKQQERQSQQGQMVQQPQAVNQQTTNAVKVPGEENLKA